MKVSAIREKIVSYSSEKNPDRPVVLYAEDQEGYQLTVSRMLFQLGFAVDVVENGEQAVQRVLSGIEYVHIFLDYMMPKMNGVEAAQQILEAKIEVGITLHTSSELSEVAKMIEGLMIGYLKKPSSKEEIKAILSSINHI